MNSSGFTVQISRMLFICLLGLVPIRRELNFETRFDSDVTSRGVCNGRSKTFWKGELGSGNRSLDLKGETRFLLTSWWSVLKWFCAICNYITGWVTVKFFLSLELCKYEPLLNFTCCCSRNVVSSHPFHNSAK